MDTGTGSHWFKCARREEETQLLPCSPVLEARDPSAVPVCWLTQGNLAQAMSFPSLFQAPKPLPLPCLCSVLTGVEGRAEGSGGPRKPG